MRHGAQHAHYPSLVTQVLTRKWFVRCGEHVRGNAITVVNLMKDLVMKRPTKKLNFLNFLLEFCSHETAKVRETANQIVLQMQSSGDYRDIIEEYSVMYLRFLISPTPPALLFGEDRGRPIIQEMWTEDIVKVCLYLFLSLLPKNQKLFKRINFFMISARGPQIGFRATVVSYLAASSGGQRGPEGMFL